MVKRKQEKRILLIGGPKKLPSQALPQVDHIRCDIAGILGHDRHFYDYDAVVYWPNEECFALPKSYSSWSKRRGHACSLPAIHRDYWKFDTTDEALFDASYWEKAAELTSHAASTLRPDARPESSIDCQLINQDLCRRCISRLREIIEGTTNDLRGIIVFPQEPVSCKLEWVSKYLLIDFHPDDLVEINEKTISTNRRLKDEIQAFTNMIDTPWKLNIRLGSDDPDNLFSAMGDMLWGDHWHGQSESIEEADWKDVTRPDAIAYKTARPSLPHINRAGDGKSLLFQTLAHDHKPERGYLLLLPAVNSCAELLDTLAKIVDSKDMPDTDTAGSDTAPHLDRYENTEPVIVTKGCKYVQIGLECHPIQPTGCKVLEYFKSDRDNAGGLSLLEIAEKVGCGGRRNDAPSRVFGSRSGHLVEKKVSNKTGVYRLKKEVQFE